MFNDLRTAQGTMGTNNPALQQQQGSMVQGCDKEMWARHRPAVLLDCLRCKFAQNPSLASKLMATHPRHLAEASATDRIYGIGLRPTDMKAWDPHQWRGDNLLGRTLERVRSELRRAEQQQHQQTPSRQQHQCDQHHGHHHQQQQPPAQRQPGSPEASADGHEAYTYEIGQRVKWFERGTGTWYPALIRERERRHDGATYYKVFSTTGSNFWTQQQHLQPNKTPVFVKGAQVHWLRQRDRKWLEATVTNDNNARLNEYEIIVTGTDEHKQTVTERLRPATAHACILLG